ncbi:MAG TPA: hypothetical protein ENO20_14565 [Bacteroides sp.]|nr:hypothetical protein [Bacteroides sp.]
MRRLLFFSTCILVLCMSGCEKYIIEKPDIPTGIEFSTDIQPIFDNRCLNCHSGMIDPDLSPGESYDALIDGGYVDTDDPESSELYTKLTTGHGKTTIEEQLLILQWITEGALNN